MCAYENDLYGCSLATKKRKKKIELSERINERISVKRL